MKKKNDPPLQGMLIAITLIFLACLAGEIALHFIKGIHGPLCPYPY